MKNLFHSGNRLHQNTSHQLNHAMYSRDVENCKIKQFKHTHKTVRTSQGPFTQSQTDLQNDVQRAEDQNEECVQLVSDTTHLYI